MVKTSFSKRTNRINNCSFHSLRNFDKRTQFEIPRTAGYYEGDKSAVINCNNRPVNIKNNRSGIGNKYIYRPSFENEPIKGRIIDFDQIKAVQLKDQGYKVTLSESSLNELLYTQIPDPNDITWLVEEERRVNILRLQGKNAIEIKQILSIDPPLGRPQKSKMVKRTDTAILNQTNNQRLTELINEVRNGFIENNVQLARITAEFSKLLTIENILSITTDQLDQVINTLQSMNLPKKSEDYNIPRFIDLSFYQLKEGIINLIILSNAKNKDLPITNSMTGNMIKITTLQNKLREKNYLDLENLEVIDRDKLFDYANRNMKVIESFEGINTEDFIQA